MTPGMPTSVVSAPGAPAVGHSPKASPTRNSPRSRIRMPSNSTGAPGQPSPGPMRAGVLTSGRCRWNLRTSSRGTTARRSARTSTLVTTVMTTANRSANTFDALIGRLRGQPVPGSRLLDELLVGTGIAVSIPPTAGVPSARAQPAPVDARTGLIARCPVKHSTVRAPIDQEWPSRTAQERCDRERHSRRSSTARRAVATGRRYPIREP